MLLDHSLSLSPSLSLPGKRCRAVQPHTPRANAPLQFMGAHASPPLRDVSIGGSAIRGKIAERSPPVEYDKAKPVSKLLCSNSHC